MNGRQICDRVITILRCRGVDANFNDEQGLRQFLSSATGINADCDLQAMLERYESSFSGGIQIRAAYEIPRFG